MGKRNQYYDLCLFSYFDIVHYQKGMSVETWIQDILFDPSIKHTAQKDLFLLTYYEALKEINHHYYHDYIIMNYYQDNNSSGNVIYTIKHQKDYYIVFRGSEPLDQVNHTTGWQDWQDNFHMFLKLPTDQQMNAWHYVENLKIDGKLHLCGHSKGGNLACFTYLCASKKLDQQIASVVSLNGPGFSDALIEPYQERINDQYFQDRLFLIESENDCISEIFTPLKKPMIVKSKESLYNFTSLFHCHNVYGYEIKDGNFIEVKRKNKLCDLCGYLINQVFMNLKKESIQKVVEKADSYFISNLSLQQLYHVFVYHLGNYTKVFDELSYEEIAELEFSTLRDLIVETYIRSKFKQFPLSNPQIQEVIQSMIEGIILKGHLFQKRKKRYQNGSIKTSKTNH